MNIAVISFTPRGYQLAGTIVEYLQGDGHDVTETVKCADVPGSYDGTVSEWTGTMFRTQDAIVYVGATGIAVRSISPYVRTKKEDPAVIVVDEMGKYCIPVLSGHIGGANELAVRMSGWIQALPVITTATDLNGKWAVDVFATKNGLYISDMKKAKEISSRILRGRKLVMEIETGGRIIGDQFPPELKIITSEKLEEKYEQQATDIYVGICKRRRTGSHIRSLSENSLCLVPKSVILGIGCRKGTMVDTIETVVNRVLDREGVWLSGVCKVASIDLKAEEQGLLEYCDRYNLPFEVYSKEELEKAPGEYTSSEFVSEVTGVDNVCERSAVMAGGRLIVRKQAYEGVTVAVAARNWDIGFE